MCKEINEARQMTIEDFRAHHSNYVGINGNPYVMEYIPEHGTCLIRVQIIETINVEFQNFNDTFFNGRG